MCCIVVASLSWDPKHLSWPPWGFQATPPRVILQSMGIIMNPWELQPESPWKSWIYMAKHICFNGKMTLNNGIEWMIHAHSWFWMNYTAKVKFMEVNLQRVTGILLWSHIMSYLWPRWPFGCVSTRKDHPLEFFNCLHWPVAIFQNISRLWYCSYCSSHPKIEQHRHRLYGKVHQCYST